MGKERFFEETFLRQTYQSSPRPSFSSFPRAFVLTESLSSLAQAVFGMTTLQRYNAPKISLAASFSFLKTNRLVQALFSPAVVLKPCFLFPAFSPCRQTKKRDSHVPLFIQRYTLRAASPSVLLGRKERGLGMGKGTLSPEGFPFPSPNMVFNQFAPRRREAFPAAGAYTAS